MKLTMKLPEELNFIENSRKPQKSTDKRIDGKVCILTGATSGVGYEAAKRLAKDGAHLVLVNRNKEKAQKVKEEILKTYPVEIELFQADFSDLAQVRQTAEAILVQYPLIDILINNAGLHKTKRTLVKDGTEIVFTINHLASFLFTMLLLDRIKESQPARIIQVNSQGHRFNGLDLTDLNWARRRYKGLQGYGASKVAQLLTVWELADRLKNTKVTINAMHPGAVATNIGMNNGLLYQWYQRYLLFPLLDGPEISGEAIYYLAAAPEMEGISGNFYNQTIKETPAKHALDRDLGKKVWDISLKMTGLEK